MEIVWPKIAVVAVAAVMLAWTAQPVWAQSHGERGGARHGTSGHGMPRHGAGHGAGHGPGLGSGHGMPGRGVSRHSVVPYDSNMSMIDRMARRNMERRHIERRMRLAPPADRRYQRRPGGFPRH